MKRQKLLAVLGWVVLGGVVMAQAPTPGGIGYSRSTASGVPGGVMAGNVELRDSSMLAAESLTNGALTGAPAAEWARTGDFSLTVPGNNATYTDSAHSGTFSQTSALGAIPWASAGINGWFSFTYTTSAVVTVGTLACTVPATFALSAQSLVLTAGTHTVVFQAMATTVGAFSVACTSAATETVTFDTLSLKAINGGNLTVQGRVWAGFGTAALPGYSFVPDPTTGMFVAVATGQLGFSLSGVSRWQLGAANLYPVANDTQSLGGASNQTATMYSSRGLQGSKSKALTDAGAAVAVIRVPVASNGHQNGDVHWDASSNDGTDYRSATGTIHFASISKGATPTCTVNVMGTDLQASSNGNTLVCTWTNVVNSTNCDLSVACVDNTAGTQTMSVNFRPDMTTTATLVYP